METRGQNNEKIAASALSDGLCEMSGHRAQTEENILNKYIHTNSRKRPFLQSPQPNLYEDEFKKMVSRMDQMSYTQDMKTVDPFREAVKLSVLANEGDFGNVDSSKPTQPECNYKSRVSIHSLLKWKRYQDKKHDVFMAAMRKLEKRDKEWYRRWMLQIKQSKRNVPPSESLMDTPPKETEGICRTSSTSEGDSSMESTPVGECMRSSGPEEDFKMGSTQEDEFGIGSLTGGDVPDQELKTLSAVILPQSPWKQNKISTCRHFAKGWCRQGAACSFLHKNKDSWPDSQKVFLGGLPHSITPSDLVQELRQLGYEVINQPKIFRGFSPQVCLASSAEAMKMLDKRKISIYGCLVEVRPYTVSVEQFETITKKELDRQLDTNKRSVFLGGLPSCVTMQMLKASIENLGMKLMNRPLIRGGFIPKVTLASAKQADKLVARGSIDINGATVSVRPYGKKQPI